MPTLFFRTTLALGLGMVFAVPATAEPETRSASVRIADLDLASPAGTHVLRHRISTALTRVCGDLNDPDLAMRSPIRTCRAEAMADAAPQIAMATARARTGNTYVMAAIRMPSRAN